MVFNHLCVSNFLIVFMIYLIDAKTIFTHIYWCMYGMYILKIWYIFFFIKQVGWITKCIQYSHQYIHSRYNLLHEVIFKGKNSLILQVLEWYCKYSIGSYGSWIYYLCNHCLSPLMLWVWITIKTRCTTLCDKVCPRLATDRCFSPGSTVSSTNKTDSYDINKILLKVALNTIKLILTKSNKLRENKTYIPWN